MGIEGKRTAKADSRGVKRAKRGTVTVEEHQAALAQMSEQARQIKKLQAELRRSEDARHALEQAHALSVMAKEDRTEDAADAEVQAELGYETLENAGIWQAVVGQEGSHSPHIGDAPDASRHPLYCDEEFDDGTLTAAPPLPSDDAASFAALHASSTNDLVASPPQAANAQSNQLPTSRPSSSGGE